MCEPSLEWGPGYGWAFVMSSIYGGPISRWGQRKDVGCSIVLFKKCGSIEGWLMIFSYIVSLTYPSDVRVWMNGKRSCSRFHPYTEFAWQIVPPWMVNMVSLYFHPSTCQTSKGQCEGWGNRGKMAWGVSLVGYGSLDDYLWIHPSTRVHYEPL